jgi:phosphatidate phosphatase APP1
MAADTRQSTAHGDTRVGPKDVRRMSNPSPPQQRWPRHVVQQLESWSIDADAFFDRAADRLRTRLGLYRPRHIAAYRGFADAQGVEMMGRVLAEAPLGGPGERDDWWDNLLHTYRRFESDEVPGAALVARFGGQRAQAVTDGEGYYRFAMPPPAGEGEALWEFAQVELADGGLDTVQPVMRVSAQARVGIISDIDDTILHSSITDWKTAAQLTFLHNARTRKPLLGVAKLYAALQAGADHAGRNPIFYVSSSPWNMYDLLEDFMALNAIPPGPIFLRDLGLEPGQFITPGGHGEKLAKARELMARMPHLRWILLGDSGQADAQLYAQAAQEFGDRLLAIYIRDVDPGLDSARDQGVDAWIQRIGGTKVPMLRVRDSVAIAEHAVGLGLIDPALLPAIAAEVERDRARPSLGQAALEQGVEQALDTAAGAVTGRQAAVHRPAPPMG